MVVVVVRRGRGQRARERDHTSVALKYRPKILVPWPRFCPSSPHSITTPKNHFPYSLTSPPSLSYLLPSLPSSESPSKARYVFNTLPELASYVVNKTSLSIRVCVKYIRDVMSCKYCVCTHACAASLM